MKADTKKCFVCFRGVMVKFVTEEGRGSGWPWGFGMVFFELSILRVSRKTVHEMMQKTVNLLLMLNLPLSIQPQRKYSPNLGQNEDSVSQGVQKNKGADFFFFGKYLKCYP